MFLFILESIGTSEMILVGIVALVFLGPRKLPELAKKAGKIMAEFRGTASEFKETWQREVNFEEEVKSISLSTLDAESVVRDDSPAGPATTTVQLDTPVIKSVDPDSFKHLIPAAETNEHGETLESPTKNDKKNWL